MPSKDGVRAVILCPTRELALQTTRELKKLIVGKKFRVRVMTKALARCSDFSKLPCDILVSTPLRLDALLKESKIDLGRYISSYVLRVSAGCVGNQRSPLGDQNALTNVQSHNSACAQILYNDFWVLEIGLETCRSNLYFSRLSN